MRRTRVAVVVVPLLVAATALTPASAAPVAPATPPRPTSWRTVPTPPMSGDTSQKVFRQVDIVPGGAAFATGWTRHDLPGTSEVRTLVERWDGSTWQTMVTPDVETAPAADYLWGISGTSATDVWAVGRSATAPGRPAARPFAMHDDGSAWTRVDVPDPSGGAGADMTAVVALAADDVWAVGTAYPLEAMGAAYHWNGTAWSSFRLPRFPGCKGTNYTELTAIAATPGGDVYAGGNCPTDAGYAGFVVKMSSLTDWQVVARMPGPSSVTDMTADAAGTVWVTGSRTGDRVTRPYLLYGAGRAWTRQYRPVPTDGTTEQASGVAVTPTGITIVGERDTRNGQRAPFAATRMSPTRWQTVTITPPVPFAWMSAVDGSAEGPVLAMGQYLGDSARMYGFGALP